MALYGGVATAVGARRLFCVLYAAALAWGSLSPAPPGRLLFGIPHADKAAHFLAYMFLVRLAIWSRKKTSSSLAVEFSFAAAAAAYGAALELAQPAVSAGVRECSIFDMAANALGAAAAVPLWRVLFGKRPQPKGLKEPAS